jgi:hypothetical protein
VPQAPAAPVAVLAGGTALRGAWLRVRVDAGSDASAVVTEALTKGGVAVEEVSPAGNGGELVILTGPASPATLTRGLAALASIGLGVEVVQQLDRLEATA